jgi:hypothetical protein
MTTRELGGSKVAGQHTSTANYVGVLLICYLILTKEIMKGMGLIDREKFALARAGRKEEAFIPCKSA